MEHAAEAAVVVEAHILGVKGVVQILERGSALRLVKSANHLYLL